MNSYTIAELRKDTRKILNEALEKGVIITRYDEKFLLTSLARKVTVEKDSKVKNLTLH